MSNLYFLEGSSTPFFRGKEKIPEPWVTIKGTLYKTLVVQKGNTAGTVAEIVESLIGQSKSTQEDIWVVIRKAGVW